MALSSRSSLQAMYSNLLVKRVGPHSRRPFTKSASTASNPYPFPNSPSPSPCQIFHLMPDASQEAVKQRYYELVRLYHPDSAESRRYQPDPALRHAQFSAITRAYERLQKRPAGGTLEPHEMGAEFSGTNPWRKAPQAHRRRYAEEPSPFIDERWKDRLIWGGLCFALVTVTGQYIAMRHRSTQNVLEHARGSTTASWQSPDLQHENANKDL